MRKGARTLNVRSETANIATLKRLLQKYDEIKAREQSVHVENSCADSTCFAVSDGMSLTLRDHKVYRELEGELSSLLGLVPPAESPEAGGVQSKTSARYATAKDSSSSSSSSGGSSGGRQRGSITDASSDHPEGESRDWSLNDIDDYQAGRAGRRSKSDDSDELTPVASGANVHLQQQRRSSLMDDDFRATASASAAIVGVEHDASDDADPRSILVVDDSHISCQLAKRALTKRKFRTEVALDGQIGLDMLYARPTHYSLVLLDIIMPGLDGIEVLSRMKQHPQLTNVPVAMFSGMQDDSLEEVCRQNGALVVLPKPMKIDDVLRVVKKYCRAEKTPATTPLLRPQEPIPTASLVSDDGASGAASDPLRAVTASPLGRSAMHGDDDVKMFRPSRTSAGGSTNLPFTAPPLQLPPPQSSSPVDASPAMVVTDVAAVAIASPVPVPPPSTTGKIMLGQEAPNVELVDERFHPFRLREALPRSKDQKLLLAFFPAAFAEARCQPRGEKVAGSPPHGPLRGRGRESVESDTARLGKEGVLAVLMENLDAIKATKTRLMGIGKDFPYTLTALAGERGLHFPLFSDPLLLAAEEFVGTFDLGLSYPAAFGRRDTAATGLRGAHAGIVVLDSAGKVLYRWVSASENGEALVPAVVDLHGLMSVLRAPTERSGSGQDGGFVASPRGGTEEGTCDGDEHSVQVDEPKRLRRLSADGRRGDAAVEPTSGVRKDEVTILVVDDSTISYKLARRKLRALGYMTIHAENGEAALGIIRRRPKLVDLILLDIVMPIMDGVELLNIIKGDRFLRHMPVVMLSGLEREQLGNACLESGAVAVLQKPLKPQEVQAVIRDMGWAPPASQAGVLSTSPRIGGADAHFNVPLSPSISLTSA